jgi:hypothetical protein
MGIDGPQVVSITPRRDLASFLLNALLDGTYHGEAMYTMK